MGTRRLVLLGIAVLAPVVWRSYAMDSGGFDEGVWQEVERAWNPFAEGMNRGVFDVRQWGKVKRAFRKAGMCEG